jgi:predicted kinase
VITLIIGPIASGKSTLCKKWANDGKIIINDDSIVNAMHAGIYGLYKKSNKPLYKSIENHILCMAIGMGLDVVIDRPCHTRDSRLRYTMLAKSLDTEIIAVLTRRELPEVHAKRRFMNNGRGYPYSYWLGVAEKHEELYEPPTMDEGYSHILQRGNDVPT